MKAAADRAGLTISCLHLAVTTRQLGGAGSLMLDSAPQRIADDLGALGVRAAVMPIAPFPADMKPRPGEGMMAMIPRAFAEAGVDHWKRTAAVLNERARSAQAAGHHSGLSQPQHRVRAPSAEPPAGMC